MKSFVLQIFSKTHSSQFPANTSYLPNPPYLVLFNITTELEKSISNSKKPLFSILKSQTKTNLRSSWYLTKKGCNDTERKGWTAELRAIGKPSVSLKTSQDGANQEPLASRKN